MSGLPQDDLSREIRALPQTVTIGADYDNPVVTLENMDCTVCGVTMDRGLDFSGRELVIDELTVTVRMNQLAAQSRISAGGAALFSDRWELLRALANIPKDTLIAGYADFYTSDGQLFLTLDGEIFQVPVTQSLDDFWESLLDGVAYGTPVWYEIHSPEYETPPYKFFWKNYRRTGKYEFVITAQSAIGLLDRPPDGDVGGMFMGNITLKSRIEGIIGGFGSVDPRLSSVKVYGWQPVQSGREALQDLMLAYGFVIRRDENGNLYVTLPDTESVTLDESRVFLGGSVERNDDKKYTRVDVTEHTFPETDNDKKITLFDNTDGSGAAANLKVVFTQAPVYGLTAAGGLTVSESNCNYAVVSGVGTLTGKLYAHVTRTVSADGVQNAYAENILSLTDAALISYLNSKSVARRIRDYYNASVTVNMDFIRRAENPGDLIQFADPYGKPRTGYLTAVKSRATSFDRASAAVVCGYAPKYWGNTYNFVITLTGTGTWTVPETLDGETVRIALISGGNGGESGQHGTDNGASGRGDEISGCQRGASGAGGKINVMEITVNAGETFAYQCGAGGAGGLPSDDYDTDENGRKTYRNNPGGTGGETTFGNHSSNGGAVSETGYHDMIHDIRYAAPGPDNGVDGGAATTATENNDRNNPQWTEILKVLVEYSYGGFLWHTYSGDVGAGRSVSQSGEYAYQDWGYGGLGGGAAVGADGEPGADVGTFADNGGSGGNGASAYPVFPDDRAYGSGGSGGHGGGEGGAGGKGYTTDSSSHYANEGRRGAGGSGSAGQDGKPGCVLIYYHN